MSNGIYKTLLDQIATLLKDIQEGKRDPKLLSRRLQFLVYTPDGGIAEYDVMAGEHIMRVAEEIVSYVQQNNAPACFKFNNIGMIANEWDTADAIVERYNSQRERKRWIDQSDTIGEEEAE